MLIEDTEDFSPPLIFECGQAFRFVPVSDTAYKGAAFGKILTVEKTPGGVLLDCTDGEFEEIWKNYFDMGLDYAAIRRKVAVNEFMAEAAEFGRGIRILRQDFWEALCSFIISQCNNIPRIRGIIARLCALCGERLDDGFYAFPSAETVAGLSVRDLRDIGSGYRAEYILSAARAVAGGGITAVKLSGMSFDEAKRTLLTINGVGNKVADCVLLYGLHMLGAFPVDVWMKRALEKYFPKDFDHSVFGEYAGIAQQYIFHYTRYLYAG